MNVCKEGAGMSKDKKNYKNLKVKSEKGSRDNLLKSPEVYTKLGRYKIVVQKLNSFTRPKSKVERKKTQVRRQEQ